MSSEGDTRSFDALYQIESICNAFEKASRSGERPAIEDFLPPPQDPTRRDVLRCLVEIDVACRNARGEKPSLEEYLSRFPEGDDVIRSCLSLKIDSADVSFESTITQARPNSEPDEVVTRLGRYELTNLIGMGGFGQVWQARDPGLRREVAIKTLRSDRIFPEKFVEAFLEEGRKLAQLEHPAILPIYDCGYEGNRCYIVSKLIQGTTLEERMRADPPLSQRECVQIVAQIADALHFAHKKGIVHRDIKPGNILIDSSGSVYLADFGLAVTEEEQLNEAPSTLGTYAYMSPEQVRGSSHLVDSRSDIYSLGVVLYRLLAGRTPYLGRNRSEWEQQIQSKPPRPLRTIKDDVPPELEEICLKCLHKDIEQRYRTAGDLADALRQTLTTTPAASVVTPAKSSRNGLLLAVAGIAVAASIAIAALNIPRERELDIVEPADDGRITPDFIRWPDHDETASRHVSPDGARLELTCEQYGMVSFGKVDDTVHEFSVDISQVNWAGGTGVFWGWGLTEDRSEIQLQTIRLLKRAPADDPVLTRTRMTLDRIYLSTGRFDSMNDEIIPKPQGEAHRLTLRFANSVLKAVEWDGVACPSLAPRDLIEGWSGSNEAGHIGVFVVGTNATFSNATLNGKPLRLRQPIEE